MTDQIKLIKYCSVCKRMVPLASSECEVCGNEYKIRSLTKTELNIPIEIITSNINDAYFSLEKYMQGKLKDYNSFNFVKAFKQLFSVATYNLQNCKRIFFYWRLNEQIGFDFQHQNFPNMEAYYKEDFTLDCLGIGEVQDTLQKEFSKFISNEEFNYPLDKMSITALDETLQNRLKTPPLGTKKKGIQFSSSETVLKVFEILKPLFEDDITGLQAVLHGEEIEHSILFKYRQNQLSEFFKRVQYNNYIINNKSELSDWICKNFSFKDKKRNVIKPFNRLSVWDVVSKDKALPSKNSRIGVVDWLPFKSKN